MTVMSTSDLRPLVLRNDLAELSRLESWIRGLSSGVSPGVQFAIQLCVEETVANIIMYGGGKDDLSEISVEIERTDDGTLIARVEDTGRQFDPTQFTPPVLAKSLTEAKVGNLGIHLVRSFASGMHYERQDDHNRLTLRFIEPQYDLPTTLT
jgi:serine/threonine-protein kinase RsbW